MKELVSRGRALVRVGSPTTHSTGARDSMAFMLVFSGLIECCMRGPG